MIISYLIGQKYYPVNYDLKRAFKYSLITMIIYAVSIIPWQEADWIKYLINSILLVGFVAYIFSMERQRFRTIVNKAF